MDVSCSGGGSDRIVVRRVSGEQSKPPECRNRQNERDFRRDRRGCAGISDSRVQDSDYLCCSIVRTDRSRDRKLGNGGLFCGRRIVFNDRGILWYDSGNKGECQNSECGKRERNE